MATAMASKKSGGKKKGGGKNKGGGAKVDPYDKAMAGLYGAEGVNAGNALINKFLPEGALGRVGTSLPGGEETLGRSKTLYDQAMTRSGEQGDIMSRMKGGLEGYSSAENQAQREVMQRGLNSNLATSMGQLAKSQARGKVYGAAAGAQSQNALRADTENRNQLEQDLMVKNIDEKQQRLRDYGQYTSGLERDEYGRRADATKGYNDTEAGLRGETLDREKINLGQSNAELAAQIGAYTGAGATAIQKAQDKAANRIQRKGINKL